MARYLTATREVVRQMLRDELKSGSDADFEHDELDLHIGQALIDISRRRPYEVKETVVSDGTTQISLSAIANLIGDKVVKVEYPVGNEPPSEERFSIFGTTLRLSETTPTSGENIYLYCNKLHSLTESASSLDVDLEKVLVDGAVAYAALAWVNQMRKQLVNAISTVDTMNTTLTSMDARITQAIADLTSGRTYIAKKNPEAITAISNMSAQITQALADLTSGRALIGAKRTDAITAIDAMATYLTQAVTDLTSGRAKIDDERTAMDTAIDNMTARISQAIADLTSGRAKINTVSIGIPAEQEYARYATVELGNAARYLDQSRGFLSEATTSDRYANYAARDLQVAMGYLNKARGYLATDQAATEYGNSAARELQSADHYLSQARGYLAIDQPATEYGVYAARELSNATAYLNKAAGYFRKFTAQLNVAASITRYEAWANRQMALYQAGLNTIMTPQVWDYR